MGAADGLLQRAVDGHGAVVALVGSAGIGKSRVAREIAAIAAARDVDVFTAYCESHTTDIPFHVVARLLRAANGISDVDGAAARDRVRARVPDSDPRTCCSSMTCWVSPTQVLPYRPSIPMPVGDD